ncbi:MAG: HAMP domain-containing histidine kinase [Deltaproteobacteria bacterium]|nr:HAMP domain-containing histidine kinase [Deltaproteobacteria bacterium]
MSNTKLENLALALAAAGDGAAVGRAVANTFGASRWLLAKMRGTELHPIASVPAGLAPAPLHGFEESPSDPRALSPLLGELADGGPLHLARLAGSHLFAADVALPTEARTLVDATLERLQGGGTLFRDRALSTISHDLRGPLNVIGFAASMLERSVSESDRQLVGKIRRASRQMEGMIRDLLDLGELEAGRLELNPAATPLKTILGHVEAAAGPVAEASDVTLERDLRETDAVVRVDAERLARAISLLVEGACRNVPKGEVTLRSGAVGDRVFFEVEDSGKPMDADTRAQLFETSERGAEAHPRAKGLALMLARRLVEAHGAAIEALESEGVRIRVTLSRAD